MLATSPLKSSASAGSKATFIVPREKGYSGVGIYTRHEPLAVVEGIAFRISIAKGVICASTSKIFR